MKTSRFSRELAGISTRLLQDYLAEAGGVFSDGSTAEEIIFRGTGWQARIAPLPDAQHGSLRLKRRSLEVFGEPEQVEKVRFILERKLIRIGG
jgi:hypothetical protein